MADSIEVDLIIKALSEGFDKLVNNFNDISDKFDKGAISADEYSKSIASLRDQASRFAEVNVGGFSDQLKGMQANTNVLAANMGGLTGRVESFTDSLSKTNPRTIELARNYEKLVKDFGEGNINLNQAREGANAIQKELKALIPTTKETGNNVKNNSMKWTELKSALDLAKEAANGLGQVFKKSFDFSELGAQVLQTSESFDIMLGVIGAAPDLLQQLRRASGGTISDFKLMSATSTLLAGAQGDVAKALANATPRLLEIARAANKLNPSLGDTTFLYNSLATGIKRSSPLILDNLGLTIKIGQANEDFAASLGKTADELTAAEKQQALLNATLEAGDVLINQVGGSIESATDQYNVFKASVEGVKNALAETANDMLNLQGVTSKLDVFNAYLDVSNQIEEAYKAGNITLAERNKLVFQHDYLMQDSEKTMRELETAANDLNVGYAGLNTQAREYTPIATANKTATQEWASASLDAAQKEYILQDATLKAKEEMIKAETAAKNIASAFSGVGLAASEAAAMTILLQVASGEMTSQAGQEALNMIALKDAVAKGDVSLGDYIAVMRDGILTQDEYNKLLGTTTSAQEGATGAIEDTEAAMLQQKQGINDTAEAQEFYNDALQQAATDLAGMGDDLYDTTGKVSDMGQSLIDLEGNLGDSTSTADDFSESLSNNISDMDLLSGRINNLPSHKSINIDISVTGDPIPAIATTSAGGGKGEGQGGTTGIAKAVAADFGGGKPIPQAVDYQALYQSLTPEQKLAVENMVKGSLYEGDYINAINAVLGGKGGSPLGGLPSGGSGTPRPFKGGNPFGGLPPGGVPHPSPGSGVGDAPFPLPGGETGGAPAPGGWQVIFNYYSTPPSVLDDLALVEQLAGVG